MDYNIIKIELDVKHLEKAEGIALMAVPYGFSVEDYSDIEEHAKNISGMLIDEELLKKDRTRATISMYITEEIAPTEAVAFLRERLSAADIPFEMSFDTIDEEDYAESWKQYYKPVSIGKKLVVVPSWEEYEKQEGEIIISLDPGMAFGTGTHESTRLCMEILEDVVSGGEEILDLGCGSGILAITGILLGGKEALGRDIDPVAVKVAKENARLLGLDEQIAFEMGDLAKGIDGKYDIICANIVADIIMRLLGDAFNLLVDGGSFICSGVIDTRADEVEAAIIAAGLTISEKREENGWVAFLANRVEKTT